MIRTSRNSSTLLRGALALVVCSAAAASQAQLLNHQWANNARTLDVKFEAHLGLQSPDTFEVARDPMNTEPDPTPMDMKFTIGDAMIRAMAAWNNAQTGWTFNLVPAGQNPTRPCIYVRLTRENAKVAQHVGGVSDMLAWWMTGNRDQNGKLLTGYIYFNVIHDFGIGKNQVDNNDDDLKFDAINVAIHELGHAIRLDHPTANGCITRANAGNIEAMEPMTNAGVHKLNPRVQFRRYPNAKDIARAKDSAKKVVKGQMNMMGYSGDLRNVAILVELRAPGSPEVVIAQKSTHLNWDGSYDAAFTVPEGPYDLAVSGPNYLKQVHTYVDIDADGANDQDFEGILGDIFSDNAIDIGDFAMLSMAFNSFEGDPNYDSNADLNGDNAVDIGDYSILSANFGLYGDD